MNRFVERARLGAGGLGLVYLLGALSAACAERPATPCVCPPAAAGAQAALTAAPAAGAEGLPGSAALPVRTPAADRALRAAGDLFAGRYAAVRREFAQTLQADLSEARLAEIVAGVRKVHGNPAEVMDAWTTVAHEDEAELPAAAVLLRMQKSDVRFRLLLVFDQHDDVMGLWLRPI